MKRSERNRAYHIYSEQRLPATIIFRDILITIAAWGLALYFSWDFLYQLTYGILYEFDADPLNDLDWATFAKQLQVSFLFSASVLAFIGGWMVSNLLLLMRTRKFFGKQTNPLPLRKEVSAYSCTEEEVRQWREQKVLTVAIDDRGQILDVVKEETPV